MIFSIYLPKPVIDMDTHLQRYKKTIISQIKLITGMKITNGKQNRLMDVSTSMKDYRNTKNITSTTQHTVNSCWIKHWVHQTINKILQRCYAHAQK